MKRQQIWFLSLVGMSLCFLSFFCGNVPSALAEEALQFEDIINMLDHSGENFNYLGTKFIIDYTQPRQSKTLVKVTYGASGWQKKEVSRSQRDEAQIILDDGKFLWHYIPSQASVVKKKRRISFGGISKRIRRQNELIQQNYHISITTPEKDGPPADTPQIPSVSGNVIVSFTPKSEDRPSWKLWIDSEHGLAVRTEIYDINGNLALLSAFSELTFQPKISRSTFTMKVPKGTKMRTTVEKRFHTIEEAQQEVGFSISEPGYLPPGFILASVIFSKTTRGEKVQLAYIDGMSSISVFEEKRAVLPKSSTKTNKNVKINNAAKGTFHDQGLLKILRWRLPQNLHITLVGEVADSELLKIASSIIK